MKLNHMNLAVTDAQESRRFLEKYFGFRSMEGTKDNATFIGMRGDDGFVLALMEVKKGEKVKYPDSFHIGFLIESKAGVQEIYQRLKEDGYDITPPRNLRGGLHLYFLAPGGFTIQVGT